jgi:hypothetical protein
MKGSAIFNNNASPEYHNTLIAQNEITDPNGVASIYNDSNSSPGFINATISMCIPDGIGIFNNATCSTSLCNSIIWSGNLLPPNIAPVIDLGNYMIYYHYCLIQNMSLPGPNLTAVNPDFINPAYTSDYYNNYGDYHLMSSSQCINFGSSSCVTATFTGDLDNNTRIMNNVDLGCYEFDPGNPNPPNDPYHKNIGSENIFPEENIISSNLSLSVYPNPIAVGQQPALFLGEGNLYYENSIDVKVYSLEGKQIHSKTYANGNTNLDIPKLSSGMYIVNVRTQEGKVYNSKLVITQ